MSAPPLTGYYGKIPTRGDFLCRGLPRNFVEPWDRWLQALLRAMAEEFREAWPERFDRLPPVRFILEAGACGPESWIGVLRPSRDRVGRRFPLTLCRRLNRRSVDKTFLIQEASWFSALEKWPPSLLEELPLREELPRRWWFRKGRSFWRFGEKLFQAPGLPEPSLWLEQLLTEAKTEQATTSGADGETAQGSPPSQERSKIEPQEDRDRRPPLGGG